MKKELLIIVTLLASIHCAAQTDNVILDLSKSATKLEFEADRGCWSGTYDDDAESIESQCFSFVHHSMSDWMTWWGFTASNSTNNSMRENFITYQFSNMAKGGIVLNEDGTVKTDEFGLPVVDSAMPYLVGFYSPYMSARPVDMTFNDGKSYEPVGVYVNLNSYAYYTIENGDQYARAFTNGDRFTLTIHGVSPDNSDKELTVELAAYENGNLTINRGWRYVDLSELGVVNELYFTLKSTDSGAYGDNTPAYFCLDKLIVKPTTTSAINETHSAVTSISYDRSTKTITVADTDFTAVYDVSGRIVRTSTESEFSIESLPAGVYVVRAQTEILKIAK